MFFTKYDGKSIDLDFILYYNSITSSSVVPSSVNTVQDASIKLKIFSLLGPHF